MTFPEAINRNLNTSLCSQSTLYEFRPHGAFTLVSCFLTKNADRPTQHTFTPLARLEKDSRIGGKR